MVMSGHVVLSSVLTAAVYGTLRP